MADAADAVAEVSTEVAPVVEAEAATAEATAEIESTEAVPAAESPDLGWVEDFGGLDKVREAAEFRRTATTTEDGAIDAFVEFGVALGLTPAQLASLFPEEAAAAVAAAEEDASELDRPMTAREVQALIDAKVLQPQAERDEQAKVSEMRTVIGGVLDAKEVPADARQKVLEFADNHVPEADRFDKSKVAAAVEAGIADYDKWLDGIVSDRIAAKVKANEALPSPVSGGTTGGGEAADEPKSLAEAKAQVRARFGGKG